MTDQAADRSLDVRLRNLLTGSTLGAINFMSLRMERKDAPAPPDGEQFPVNITLGMQVTDEGAAYRVSVGVDRPDIEVAVDVVVFYATPDPSKFLDEAAAQEFGVRVAVPAVYPFARAKLHELTVDSGVRPVMLGILDMTRWPASLNGEANEHEGR